jgi:hypothetical protein
VGEYIYLCLDVISSYVGLLRSPLAQAFTNHQRLSGFQEVALQWVAAKNQICYFLQLLYNAGGFTV